MCRKLCHFIWGIWWFHRSKYFEAMKAGKLANITRIRSWTIFRGWKLNQSPKKHWLQYIISYSLLKWECSFEFISTHCAISFYFGNELSTSHPYICWLSLVAQWYQLFHSFLEKPTYYYGLGLNNIWRSMLWQLK